MEGYRPIHAETLHQTRYNLLRHMKPHVGPAHHLRILFPHGTPWKTGVMLVREMLDFLASLLNEVADEQSQRLPAGGFGQSVRPGGTVGVHGPRRLGSPARWLLSATAAAARAPGS
jgi:hypothetical protein